VEVRVLWGKLREIVQFEDLGVGWKITLNWALNEIGLN
jgi:hypothetical protein